MVQKTTYSMKFRRRREGKTDYRKRLGLLKSRKPRLVVRITARNVLAQVVKYNAKGDEVLATASSAEVRGLGFKGHAGNAEAAYLTGMLCAKKAIKAGVKEAMLDIGLHTPVNGSNVFAALRGALDGGMDIPHDGKCFPAEERIKTGKGEAAREKILKG
ncbi:MAG: 50S ribosomal protein L18 [Candidatus Diapherotrites archaeon]|nr:50S ribosomal protein L18 [Candidatus Diapherotrites archaeon]